ncbi:Pre-rRNA-processing protein TSR2-domain-containing protein [Suillus clintonianus]|uniref:Pre-rRNA-processing protein TSR2-domain-containing protein n=1 Tax=Suillus clintonianus TaxID=1904413 RepID=UPI001B883E35|nr:Pre-rRNA-processing protein TSR2-domain-containing protein [Suillus clintonianus]KAG2139754.1 Pre-rRNA-processing protein TSR2-domain-containing protein [Suillus clintonianus]
MASDASPISVLFARGLLARLALWPALRIAVHQNWGGPQSAQKQRWLAGVITDEFEASLPPVSVSLTAFDSHQSASMHPSHTLPEPDTEYIETMLLQIMDDEFEVALEDGSAFDIARDVVRLWNDAKEGRDGYVKDLEMQADRMKGKMPQFEVEAGSASDWEDSDGDSEDESGSDGEDYGKEVVPQLLDHAKEAPDTDDDGFTIVKRKGGR